MPTQHRILLMSGFVSLMLAVLPWLGFGCCNFAVAGIDFLVPQLALLNESMLPFGRLLNPVMEIPLQLLGFNPPVGDLVFFQRRMRAPNSPVHGVCVLVDRRYPGRLDYYPTGCFVEHLRALAAYPGSRDRLTEQFCVPEI
jgi:hypothetical protein